MTNIKDKVLQIRQAIFGKDVRESIASGIEEINKEVENNSTRQLTVEEKQSSLEVQFEEQIKNITLQDPSSAELVAARINSDGQTYATVGKRLNEVDTQLAEKAKKIEGRISIKDFEHLVIDKGLITEDWKDAMQSARDYIANQTIMPKLVFPKGIYQYSVSPNWAISDAIIEAEGEVRLRYTGTENAVIIDGGEVTGLAWHITFGKFFIECPSTAKNALFVRGIHASDIKAKVLGAGTEYAGLRVEWCVCTDFDVIVSNNHEGWYLNSKPKYGYYIDKRELQPAGQGGYTSWCSFTNPKVEGCQIGIYLDRSQGCSFYSGTSEGNTDVGIYLTANAIYNKFYSIDLEVNTNQDILCLGRENEFYSIDNTGVIEFNAYARDNVFFGGSHKNFVLGGNTYGNVLNSVKYNRFNDGSVINDVSGKNRLVNNRNVGLNRSENRPASSSAITLGASPYTYVNESGNDEMINIFGGTISNFLYVHGGYGDSSNIVPQFIRLCPGDSIRVTYSSIPTIRKYTT